MAETRAIRWQGYDHANVGAYYLTIVTDDRRPLFGRIADGVMHPSSIGELAQRCWDAIPEHLPHVDVGEFVVMPNHVQGIVVIRDQLVRGDGAVDGAMVCRGRMMATRRVPLPLEAEAETRRWFKRHTGHDGDL